MIRAGLCAAVLALAAGCVTRGDLVVRPRYVPDLRLEAVGPTQVKNDALHGRVLLVSFMATWCIPCLQELEHLKQLQKRYASTGFSVVLVGMDLEGALVLEPFADHYALEFPLLIANEHIRTGQSSFGAIKILPTSFLVARDGSLRALFQGIAEPAELEAMIERELAASR